jgi:hypothetical protein
MHAHGAFDRVFVTRCLISAQGAIADAQAECDTGHKGLAAAEASEKGWEAMKTKIELKYEKEAELEVLRLNSGKELEVV